VIESTIHRLQLVQVNNSETEVETELNIEALHENEQEESQNVDVRTSSQGFKNTDYRTVHMNNVKYFKISGTSTLNDVKIQTEALKSAEIKEWRMISPTNISIGSQELDNQIVDFGRNKNIYFKASFLTNVKNVDSNVR
jgi:hypothetical protein